MTIRSELCPLGYSDAKPREPSTKGWLVDCPNMKALEGDTSMEYEHYECKACGATTKLDYEEMR
jgi:hypothetical protein